MATYDRIGIGYDATRKADPLLAERLRDLLDAAPGAPVLDIGCGTGNYTRALAASGLKLTGLDPSQRMLEQARAKSHDIDWVCGAAEAMPFTDASFHAATAILTLHHWADIGAGSAETARVLVDDARFVVFTSTPEQTGAYWLRHYFPRMIERSAHVLPTEERIMRLAHQAGLELLRRVPYTVEPDLQDHFLFSQKHRPAAYLQADFRRGISSFALLAPPDELRKGLASLTADIDAGRWPAVRDQYAHDEGDYLHLVFRRVERRPGSR